MSNKIFRKYLLVTALFLSQNAPMYGSLSAEFVGKQTSVACPTENSWEYYDNDLITDEENKLSAASEECFRENHANEAEEESISDTRSEWSFYQKTSSSLLNFLNTVKNFVKSFKSTWSDILYRSLNKVRSFLSPKDYSAMDLSELQAELDKKEKEYMDNLEKIRNCDIKIAILDKKLMDISRRKEEEDLNFKKVMEQLSKDRALHEAKYKKVYW